ncbi:MAG: VWA domain-containing protein [Acidobacteria bacterium]|nr:VWA domain-containing protein [Acidobacteriota bacterium]
MRPAAFLIALAAACAVCGAQQTPAPTLTPPAKVEREEQEPIKVFTQEVRVPVAAFDQFERFDPTLEARDLLVLEDGVPQTVTSVSRVAASVLVVFDMGSSVTATRSGASARDAALGLISAMRYGDRVAVLQNSRRVELVQDWTDDLGFASHALKTRFFTAERSRLSDCLALAAAKLKEQPVGNTHVVVFTDGLEFQSREQVEAAAISRDALRAVVATQASVHVFSFAALVSDFARLRNQRVTSGASGSTVRVTIDTDNEMRRWFRTYARAQQQREEQLSALAAEAGGRLLQPRTPEEIAKLTERVGRDIAAQYVVTYKPQRPFTPDNRGERRRVEVRPRRSSLQLECLRTIVTVPAS